LNEVLHPEQPGFIELDEGEKVESITQFDIAKVVDITSAQKFFELHLEKFGPYKCDYSRNGRNLLVAGRKGHIAAIDWQTKKLMCEMNVMETVHDIAWLHQETWFAMAQKQWTYIYDNQGIELHCLKLLDSVLRLEYLPYHALLASSNVNSYLCWIDVTVGKKVSGFGTGLGRLDVMCQNPTTGVLHLGHSGGTVTMWTPNCKEPQIKMLCHGGGTRSVAVDFTGRYMATSGVDRKLKVWDLRALKELTCTPLKAGAAQLAYSQRGLLACTVNRDVRIYRDVATQPSLYLLHRVIGNTDGLKFCPYEDVLGLGHANGFTSLLVPGAGEPNYDALEANPYQSKKQRREAEVKMILDKIQPDMLSINPGAIGQVNVKTLQEKMAEKAKLMWIKPQKVDFEPRHRKKGRSKAGKHEKRRQGVIEERKRDDIRRSVIARQKESRATEQKAVRQRPDETTRGVLERFKKKKSASAS
jgi:U3 small nucleolar RNA-associated protein 7